MSGTPGPGVTVAAPCGNLASVLLDIVTDYAAPLVERFGLSPAALRVLQDLFRPEVEFLGSDMRGVVAAELDGAMQQAFAAMEKGGADPRQAAAFLYSLCDGAEHWGQNRLDDWAWTKAAWTDPTTNATRQLAALFTIEIAEPLGAVRSYEQGAEKPWMTGRRSAWDTIAFARAYEALGIPPAIGPALERRFVRSFAARAVASLSPEMLAEGHEAAQGALAEAGEYEAAGALLPLQTIAARSDADWQIIARGLTAAGFRAGS